jgi:hypothetical protein
MFDVLKTPPLPLPVFVVNLPPCTENIIEVFSRLEKNKKD